MSEVPLPYLYYESTAVSKSYYETTLGRLRLTRSNSAAEARGHWRRRQLPEFAPKKDV